MCCNKTAGKVQSSRGILCQTETRRHIPFVLTSTGASVRRDFTTNPYRWTALNQRVSASVIACRRQIGPFRTPHQQKGCRRR
uniref:DUF1534 domain-containing protein n=1 Tax=Panagrellus redivivus TaxID=6233 RepID=A0A7E4V9J1_PANRE